MFFALLFYFLFLGGETRYILETGFQSLGNMANLFVAMRIGGITLEEALKEAIPVILVEILILAIMIMCPWLITFLPNLLM